jgi:hypothetical protein
MNMHPHPFNVLAPARLAQLHSANNRIPAFDRFIQGLTMAQMVTLNFNRLLLKGLIVCCNVGKFILGKCEICLKTRLKTKSANGCKKIVNRMLVERLCKFYRERLNFGSNLKRGLHILLKSDLK